MTSTFSYRPVSKNHQQFHLQVPPSSPFFQMPNVFVIPPEEEQFETPPWCYFDAAEASPSPPSTQYSTSPDFDSLDLALNIINQPEAAASVLHRSQPHSGEDIVMPKKREKRSRLEYIADSTVDEFQAVSQSGNDSMVVEVIKVRRSDTGDVRASATKRSKTFKSRASKAFRSIKNVGRSNKPPAKDIWPSSTGTKSTIDSTEEQHDVPPQTRSPARSKRSSILLSQLFQSPKSCSTYDLGSPQSPTESRLTRPDTSPSLDNFPVLPMDPNIDMPSLRTVSPAPSTTKSTSSKNRFSILDLHRLFSFSSSSPISQTRSQPMSPPSASSTPSMSREPSTTSSTSIDTPDTPMDVEDVFPTRTPPSAICTSSSFRDSAESVKDYGEGEWRSTLVLDEPGRGDIGHEMRLDSLHFDSLSFDPDYF